MPLVAVIGTPIVGAAVGVIGTPPLLPIPGRPKVNGLDVAMVGDQVQVVYDDVLQGTQVLVITAALASLFVKVNGIQVALQGTLLSDSSLSLGVPPQVVLQAL